MPKSSAPRISANPLQGADPFRQLVEAVVDYAIYMIDLDGIITTWNEGAARIFGFTSEEIIGRHRKILFTAEDLAAGTPEAERERALTEGRAREERWGKRKDGSRFWASGVLTALHDSSGNLCGFLKITRDLTERKQAEGALQVSEERYRSLFNAIADPLFVYDRETLKYLAVNEAAIKKYGYSRDEFLSMTIKDIRPAEDVTALLDMLATTGTGFEDRGVWRHRKKDGTIMEMEISAHGLEYDGRPACVIEARDVTEKRRLAAEAKRTSDLLQAITDGTSDAVFVKDREGKYLFFNKAAEAFVGKPAAEVLGKDDRAIFTPASAAIAMESDRRVMETNQATTREERLTASGITRVYEAIKSPYRDAHGNILGVMGVSREITERVRAEEELRQQQRLLRIAGRVARIGGWSFDIATQLVTWSDEIREIHEVAPGYQPTLAEALQFYTPADRERITQYLQRCTADGTPFDFELQLTTAKGRRFWVRSIGEAVRDSNNQIVSLQGAFQDITERKQAEAQQRQLAERLATTLENITDGFITLDREWHITYVNAAAERLISRNRHELIGTLVWETFPETLGVTFEREYRRAVEQNVTVEFEEYFPPLNKWFAVRAYPSERGLAIYFRDVTAARNLTAELEKERSRLIAAQAVAKVGSWETDLKTLDVIWSAETYRIFEQSQDQFQPSHPNFLQLVHPEDRAAVDRAFQESLHLDTPQKIDHRIVMADGRIKFVQERWQAIFDSSGKPVRVIGTCQDITEQKQAEEAVRESEERFRLVSKATNDAIWDWDLLTDAHYWNEGFETLFGYDREKLQLTIQAWTSLLHPDDKEAIIADVQRAIDGAAESWAGEYRFMRADGTVAYVLDRGYIIRNPAGKAVRMIGSMTDLTARKQAEETLLLRERAIQAVSQGIIISDPSQADNPIIYASQGFERMTGYGQADVIGKNCRFMQGPDTDRETVRELRTAIAEQRSCTVELLNYRRDGQPFWNELTITPVRDATGQLTHFIGMQTDVTERRRLEEQYRQAQKMEAVGRLAGGVAHDFNNLLTIISGNCEMVLESPQLDTSEREAIDLIRDASERAATLTRQLLGFSRQTILQPRLIDPNTVVTQITNLLKRLIGEDVCLSTALDPQVSRVKADPSQLDQVLMNLAVNARDAMPTGGKLTITTSNVLIRSEQAAKYLLSKPGEYVLLAMSDTGVGMTPEVLARIFEPFYTTKEVGHGTGLGLAMVFGIVQQSGGFIHVESQPGAGSTFQIYLPAVSAELPEQRGTVPKGELSGTETILLVEDEEAVRGLILSSLQRHGYHVLAAQDGPEALRIATAHQGALDLILTDVVMPDLSGPELAKQVHAAYPQAKLLFMSGYTDDAVVRHGLNEAEMAFIQKPFSPENLVQKVRQVLDERVPAAPLG